MNEIGKMLIFGGTALIILGVLFMVAGKVPGFGKLPGDIMIKRQNFTFYFPVMTSIVLSIILSLLFYLFNRR